MSVLLFGFFLLATSYTSSKYLLTTLPISFLTSFKLIGAGLIFFISLLINGNIKYLLKKIIEDRRILFFICVVTTCFPYFLKMYCLKYLSSSQAMIVGSLDPFITTGLAFFLLKNRLTYNKFIGILLGTFSIILLFYFDQNLLFFQFGFSQFMAILCGILAIAIGRYGWMKSQALLVSNRYTVFEFNFIILIGGGIASSLLTWLFTSESSLLNMALDTTRIILLLYTTIIGNVLFYYIYSSALKKYSIVSISYCGLIIPFSGHFLGWIFLDEPLSTTFFFAIFMIFLGYRFYFLPTEKKPFLLKENSN